MEKTRKTRRIYYKPVNMKRIAFLVRVMTPDNKAVRICSMFAGFDKSDTASFDKSDTVHVGAEFG